MIQGDKNIIKFDGDHNSPRPQFYYDSITIFFYNVLRPPDAPVVPEVPEPIFFDDALDIDDLDEVHTPLPLPSFEYTCTFAASCINLKGFVTPFDLI